MIRRTELVESFEKHLALFKTSPFSAISGITEILQKSSEDEKKDISKILSTDRTAVKLFSLISSPTISELAIPLLDKNEQNEQEVIDFLFSQNRIPHPFVIKNISEKEEFQDKLHEIGITRRSQFPSENVCAAISQISATGLDALIRLQRNKAETNDKLVTAARNRIYQLIEKENNQEVLRKIAKALYDEAIK